MVVAIESKVPTVGRMDGVLSRVETDVAVVVSKTKQPKPEGTPPVRKCSESAS